MVKKRRRLCLQCSFSGEVWLLVRNWAGDGAVPEGSVQNVEMWWAATLAGSAFDVEAEKIDSCNTYVHTTHYTAWHVWKDFTPLNN